jgi:hypothetical protein
MLQQAGRDPKAVNQRSSTASGSAEELRQYQQKHFPQIVSEQHLIQRPRGMAAALTLSQ